MVKFQAQYRFSNEHNYSRKLEPKKLDIIKESVETVSKEYCAESSICGLKHLVDDNTPFLEKIFWIAILFVGLICSVSIVWMTFMKYYSAPLVTTQMPEGVSVSKIIFPAVGICSNNRISKRAVTELARELLKAERNKDYTEEEMMSLLFGLGQLYDLQSMSDDIVQPLQLHKALGDYDVHELIKNLTPRCEDLLIRCVWNTESKNCLELFDFRLTVNGYCCTFNYLRASDARFDDDQGSSDRNLNMYKYGNQSTFDFDQGLKVMLRLNESDDFFYNIPLQGAQMTVMVSASFTEASRDIQHVPIKLRNCRFYDESSYLSFYTYSDCILKCRMFFLLENCNCTPFNMPKMENTRTCDMRDVKCLRIFYAQSISVRPNVDPVPPELELELVGGGIHCPMCCPTCSKTAYKYDFNNVIIYPEYLNTIPDDDRGDWLKGANYTGTSIVHVKYAREVADCYGQNVIMKWFDLISNIGSTCGFVTGFSFVSVLEFIYFFTIKFIREVRNRRLRKIHTASTVEVKSPMFDPTRYRPIYWNEITGATNFRNNVTFY